MKKKKKKNFLFVEATILPNDGKGTALLNNLDLMPKS